MYTDAQTHATALQALQTLCELNRWTDVVNCGMPLLSGAVDSTAHVLVSLALRQMGRMQAALDVARQALARWPADADACLATVNAELALDLFVQAERHARCGLQHAPDDARLVAVLGRALLGLGQYQAAQTQFSSALGLRPESAYYRYLRAIAFWNLRQHDHARSLLDEALAVDPLEPDYLEMRAEFEEFNDLRLARQLARQALGLNPLLPRAQALLYRFDRQRRLGMGGMALGWLLNVWVQWGPAFDGLMGLAWACGAGVALYLSARLPARWLWVYCGVHALVSSAGNTLGLPPLLQAQGVGALLSPEALIFVAGNAVIMMCMVVLVTLVRWLLWQGLCSAWDFTLRIWAAHQQGGSRALLADVLQRPRVRFNIAASVAMLASAAMPTHIAVLWHAFGLVPLLWVLARWQLAAEHRPSFSVLWWMLGWGPAIFWMLTGSHLQSISPTEYSGLALLLGLYGAMLANQAQEMG